MKRYCILLASVLMGAMTSFAQVQASQEFLMSMTVAPDGKHVLVLDAGSKPSVSVRAFSNDMTRQAMTEISRVPIEDGWLGLAFAPNGRTAYAGGGFRGSIYEFTFDNGALKRSREFKASDFVGDVTLSPDGRLIYAADLFKNVIVVVNPQSGRVIDQFKTGRRPYRIVFHPDGKSYFVSSWADGTVYQYNVANGEEINRIRLAPQTTDMILSGYKPTVEEGQDPIAWKYRLYVAASNTNNVLVVGVNENKTMQLVDTIHVAPEALTPLGMTPSALALSADQKQLYVACSDADVIASVNVSDRRGVLEEFIPTGAYPTAVRIVEDRVISVNGLGGAREAAATSAEGSPGRRPEHVLYLVPVSNPVQKMQAIAGIAPAYTMKFSAAFASGRKKTDDFDGREPANPPPAGYLWSNARSAGLATKNYGISELGQISATPDWLQGFLADLRQAENTGAFPALVIAPAVDGATVAAIRDAIQKSRFAASTEVVTGDLPKTERLLGLRPMTRGDAGPAPLR